MKSRVLLSLMALLAFARPAAASCENPGDIVEALGCLSGITFREVPSSEEISPDGYRRFEITIDQPVDHFDASHGRFKQRLVLLHKDLAEPMVLQTSGYKIFAVKLAAISQAFETNQLQVEHRYFEAAAPAVLNWKKLDILQSANDFHRITQEFKKIYKGRWVNTGGSKGGMTSVFHRRFFPADLDGTVADVAPLSYTTEDPRYLPFVAEVGGEKYRECRDKLKALQLAVLQRRTAVAAALPGNYFFLGGKSVALEHAIIELPFIFWQYTSPEDPQLGCAKIPAADAPAAELAAFANKASPLTTDLDILTFMPYFYQAATQLGSPGSDLSYLEEYRLHPYRIDQYTPPGVSVPYTDVAMRDIEQWVREKAERIMFVYGEFDPWSAGAYPKGHGADFHWYQVPGGSHRSNLFALPAAKKEQALGALRAWLGKREARPSLSNASTLDEVEHRIRHRMRIP